MGFLRSIVVVAWAMTPFAFACGGDDATTLPTDGGGDADSGTLMVAAPTPPAGPASLPESPRWTCPPGWASTADGEGCAPHAGPAAECAGATMQGPGDDECLAIGTACGTDDWATGLPSSGEVVYVKPGGSPSPDGTRAAPYGTITEAIAAAPAGAIIALARGEYAEPVVVDRPLTLWGACVGETVIRAPVTAMQTDRCRGRLIYDVGVVLEADGVELRNLHVDGVDVVGVDVRGSDASLRDLLVSGGGPVGVLASGGDVAITDVAVRGDPTGAAYREGIHVECDSQSTLSRVSISDSTAFGFFAHGDTTTVQVEDLSMRHTRASSGEAMGLAVFGGATVGVSRAYVSDTWMLGVIVTEAGSNLRLEDAVIEDVEINAAGEFGYGILAGPDSQLEARRVLVSGVGGAGIVAAGAGATVEDAVVRDVAFSRSSGTDTSVGVSVQGPATGQRVVVRDVGQLGIAATGPAATGSFGDVIVSDVRGAEIASGVLVELGAQLEIQTALVERAATFGVMVDADGHATLSDVTIRGPATGNRGFNIAGINATNAGSVVDGTRVRIEEQERFGVFVGFEATARFEDLIIDRPQPIPLTQEDGLGLFSSFDAVVEAQRVLIRGAHTIGMQALGGAQIEVSDLAIVDTEGQVSDGDFGRGIQLSTGASLMATRSLIPAGRDFGIAVLDEGTSASFRDLVVERTRERECAGDGRCEVGWGIGLGVFEAASVDVQTFRISDNALAGVQVTRASLDLRDGVVSGNPIGANVQANDYDVSRLNDGVAYRDNGTNLDGELLPVPDVFDPFEE